jgi:hypothetical protein
MPSFALPHQSKLLHHAFELVHQSRSSESTQSVGRGANTKTVLPPTATTFTTSTSIFRSTDQQHQQQRTTDHHDDDNDANMWMIRRCDAFDEDDIC